MQVHHDEERVVITVDALPERSTFELLVEQLRALDSGLPVVLDIGDAMVLRPAEVRELGSLLELLHDQPVWIACRRLSGRRMLRCLLGGRRGLVGRPEEVPPARPGDDDPLVRLNPA
jgi:hypothetical protein